MQALASAQHQLYTVGLCHHTMLQALSILRLSVLAGCLQSVRNLKIIGESSSTYPEGPVSAK